MLNNLKVIELASVLAGPDVGMFFSELGAEVIKIENKKTGGDVTRNWKSATENKDSTVSAYFSSVNYKKQHLLLDLALEEDRNTVYNLVKSADIIIANYKPGAAKKLKMDYESIRSINPTIIYGEINGYGKDNKRAAYDVVLQAETGFMSINGTQDSGPVKMPVALIDVFAAHQLKEGLLLALLKKEKTGKGSFVEVSLYDASISSLKNQATNWLMNNFIPQRIGSIHPNIAPYGETFITKDNKCVVLGIGSDKHFNILLEIIGAKELSIDERYKSNQLRVINRKELEEQLTPYFEKKSSLELMPEFINQNIPVGLIKNLKEVFEDESAKSLILEENIEGINTKRIKTAVFKISD